jgi:hypothetical protein
MIASVDNFAFQGEVGPIVIVALLLAVTAIAGAIRGRRGWVPAAVAWACLPLAHLVKRVFDLPDTPHPNTAASVMYLAAFPFVVVMAGMGFGMLVHRFATGPEDGGAE